MNEKEIFKSLIGTLPEEEIKRLIKEITTNEAERNEN